MDDYLAKPFTLEQMRAMLETWLTLPEQPKPPRLAALTVPPPASDRLDERVMASLRQFQRDRRPDIVQEVVRLFFKGAAGLPKDLECGAAAGDLALLHSASHVLKSANANVVSALQAAPGIGEIRLGAKHHPIGRGNPGGV
jgi:two-component system, sensor histidine kinase and response regulator